MECPFSWGEISVGGPRLPRHTPLGSLRGYSGCISAPGKDMNFAERKWRIYLFYCIFVLACLGMSWHVLACLGMSWHVLACLGTSLHYAAIEGTQVEMLMVLAGSSSCNQSSGTLRALMEQQAEVVEVCAHRRIQPQPAAEIGWRSMDANNLMTTISWSYC